MREKSNGSWKVAMKEVESWTEGQGVGSNMVSTT